MTTIDEKLRRGYDLLRRARDEEAMLGAAMITFHGALEDHLDEMLRRDPDLDPQIRAEIDADRLGWLPRADAALARGLLTPTQRNIALDANRLRQEVAHGEPFAGSAASVDQYAAFVAEVTGRGASGRAARTSADEAPTAAYAAAGSSAWNERSAKNSARRTSSNRARTRPAAAAPAVTMLPWPTRSMMLTAVGAIIAVLLLIWMLNGIFGSQPNLNEIASNPPTVAPLPTPAPQLATIARLGGAVGQLRTQPSFNAPTQPANVTDGTRVTVLNRPSVTAEGTTWRYVSSGGYDGWVPEHNLDIAPPAGVG